MNLLIIGVIQHINTTNLYSQQKRVNTNSINLFQKMKKHYLKDDCNPFHTKNHTGLVHIAWGLTNEEFKLVLYEAGIKTKQARKNTSDDRRRSMTWDKRTLYIKSNTLSPSVIEFLLQITNEGELKQALSLREEVAHDDRPTSKSNFVR